MIRVYRHIYSPGLVKKPPKPARLPSFPFDLILIKPKQFGDRSTMTSNFILPVLISLYDHHHCTLRKQSVFFFNGRAIRLRHQNDLSFSFSLFISAIASSHKLIYQTSHTGVIFCISISIAGVTRTVCFFNSSDLSVRENHGKGIH